MVQIWKMSFSQFFQRFISTNILFSRSMFALETLSWLIIKWQCCKQSHAFGTGEVGDSKLLVAGILYVHSATLCGI